MEAAPGLTMSSKPTSRTASPAPPSAAEPPKQDSSSEASGSKEPASPAETIKPVTASDVTPTEQPHTTVERAFQHGLSRSNLEAEVTQVMGTFNSWWGGFKKQSANAYTTIKADVDKTVSQVQADFEYLKTAKVEIVTKDLSAPEPKPESTSGEDIKGKGKAKETTSSGEAVADLTPGTTFLTKITSSTSQLQQALQTTFQSTLASASSNPALSNPIKLRDQLAENLRLSSAKQNLQLSMKQAEKLAEDYLKRGDQWIKDAEKWMEDNVRVIPPEDDDDARYIASSWDGGDLYMFSTSASAKSKVSRGDVLFDEGGKTPRPSTSGAALAGSRKEALLTRLREDKGLLMVDPEGEEESEERKVEFRQWVKDEWPKQSKEGREKEEKDVGQIRMELVPEALTDEQFWQRYFFHKSMIEAEDEKRKKVLEASQQAQQQEEFSWDDEGDESNASSPTGIRPPGPSLAQSATTIRPPPESSDATTPTAPEPADGKLPKVTAPAVAKSLTSASTSPRDSEESYDLVSDQGKGAKAAPASSADDEDSDWE